MDIDDFQEMFTRRYVRNKIVLTKYDNSFLVKRDGWPILEELSVRRSHKDPRVSLLKRDLFDVTKAWSSEGERIGFLSNLVQRRIRDPKDLSEIDYISLNKHLKQFHIKFQHSQYLVYSEIKKKTKLFTVNFSDEFENGNVRMTARRSNIGYVHMHHLKYRKMEKNPLEELIDAHIWFLNRRKKKAESDFELFKRARWGFDQIMKYSEKY